MSFSSLNIILNVQVAQNVGYNCLGIAMEGTRAFHSHEDLVDVICHELQRAIRQGNAQLS